MGGDLKIVRKIISSNLRDENKNKSCLIFRYLFLGIFTQQDYNVNVVKKCKRKTRT